MSHFIPDHDDQVLLERDALVGGIRISAEKLEAFSEQLDQDLAALVRKWQPLAAPRAMLANRRITSWR